MLIKDPKNTFIDLVSYFSASAIALYPLSASAILSGKFNDMESIPSGPKHPKYIIKTLKNERPAYFNCIAFFSKVLPYLGAAYITGTFSPIVSEECFD